MQVNNLISSQTKPIAEPPVRPAEDDDFSFDDFLDVINPLQHLPVVGTLYREITGDGIEAPAKLAGGALFGGFYGFLGALGSVAFEDIAGESLEEMVLSLFESEVPAAPQAQAAYKAAQGLVYSEIERAPFYGDGARIEQVAVLLAP